MIRRNAQLCKLFHKNFSTKFSCGAIFKSQMDSFHPELEVCPCCGATGFCRIHAYYDRTLIDISDGRRTEEHLCVMRVICKSCNHTHAVLPAILIPYRRYSLPFILRILAYYFLRSVSAEKVSEHFHISINFFWDLLALWKEHKALWLGLLKDTETKALDFLVFLRDAGDDISPLALFPFRFSISFLQAHANPPP